MDSAEESALRERLELLNRLDYELGEQDTLAAERAALAPFEHIAASQRSVLKGVFDEIVQLQLAPFVEPGMPYDVSVTGIRHTIRSVRAKVIWERKRIRGILGMPQLPGEGAQEPVQPAGSIKNLDSLSDPKKVFVVFGRNSDARKAIFDFLTHVGLKPMEWEQAIAATGSMAPSNLTAIERAFAVCRAAVVILTGDDIAHLGKRYVEAHDDSYDINPTRQARPNVIFEAGMAFGKLPERTLIVSFGKTRKFTDVDGINILHLSDNPQSRQKIVDRLRIAKCEIDISHQTDWMKAGDFAAAFHSEQSVDWTNPKLTVIRKHPSPEETAKYKPKVWIELQNDGESCLDVAHLGWIASPRGVQIENSFKCFQIKLGNSWCPPDPDVIGTGCVAPGSAIRFWVQPTSVHDMEDLKRRVGNEGQIGKVKLRVNGRDVDIDI